MYIGSAYVAVVDSHQNLALVVGHEYSLRIGGSCELWEESSLCVQVGVRLEEITQSFAGSRSKGYLRHVCWGYKIVRDNCLNTPLQHAMCSMPRFISYVRASTRKAIAKFLVLI